MASRTIALTVAVALVAAACGDDEASDSTAVADNGQPDGEVTEPDEAGPAAPADEDPSASDDVDAADLGGDIDTSGLEDMVDDFNTGEGGGTITIDGSDYVFEAEACIAGEMAFGSFAAEGPGTTSDGTPFYGLVSLDTSSREDLEDFVDESTLEIMFPEGTDSFSDIIVAVDVGRTEMFGDAPEDQPSWEAATVLGDSVFGAEVDYELD